MVACSDFTRFALIKAYQFGLPLNGDTLQILGVKRQRTLVCYGYYKLGALLYRYSPYLSPVPRVYLLAQ